MAIVLFPVCSVMASTVRPIPFYTLITNYAGQCNLFNCHAGQTLKAISETSVKPNGLAIFGGNLVDNLIG